VNPYTISISEDARNLWCDFWQEVEVMLSDNADLSHIRDWGGKLPGAVARIAGIFHCIRHATVQIQDYEVSGVDMDNAVKLGRVLIQHALKVFDAMRLNDDHHNARAVLQSIKREGMKQFTARDCHRHHQSRFKTRQELDPALNILESAGWIRQKETVPNPKGGRPSIVYEVNPAAM
jgi:hypothetical protein